MLLSGLRKSFGDVKAVQGADIVIAPGSTVALLGPNGAGKTTTIDMLLGLLEPDAGKVSLFGRTPSEAVRAGLVGRSALSPRLVGSTTSLSSCRLTGLSRRAEPV